MLITVNRSLDLIFMEGNDYYYTEENLHLYANIFCNKRYLVLTVIEDGQIGNILYSNGALVQWASPGNEAICDYRSQLFQSMEIYDHIEHLNMSCPNFLLEQRKYCFKSVKNMVI